VKLVGVMSPGVTAVLPPSGSDPLWGVDQLVGTPLLSMPWMR
jgi:hypothetical protein